MSGHDASDCYDAFLYQFCLFQKTLLEESEESEEV